MTLPALYTLADVCEALSMSDRWVRDQIKAEQFPVTRLGHKIRFTEAQYRTFVERHSTQQVAQSVTTGRKRR